MPTINITQLHRLSLAKKDAEGDTWTTVNFDPDDLGQDTQASINIAPRKSSRASSKGTTEKPIAGTYDSFSGSVTILADQWKAIGRALGKWEDATYDKHAAGAGHMRGGGSSELCDDDTPVMVVLQGICDTGSSADVVLSRCYPSLDDDIEIGAGDTQEVTISLNPQIYNEATMSEDGYPQYDYNLGDASLTEKQRYNAATGKYEKVVEE